MPESITLPDDEERQQINEVNRLPHQEHEDEDGRDDFDFVDYVYESSEEEESDEDEQFEEDDDDDDDEDDDGDGVDEDEAVDEEEKEWKVDGLFCPICIEPWCNSGLHVPSCLPCGHMFGMSCIKKWLEHCRSLGKTGKCPQCKRKCTLKGIRRIYGSEVVVVDEESQKRITSLEAKYTALEKKVKELSSYMERHFFLFNHHAVNTDLVNYGVFNQLLKNGHVPETGPHPSWYRGPDGEFGGYPGAIFEQARIDPALWGPKYLETYGGLHGTSGCNAGGRPGSHIQNDDGGAEDAGH